MNADGEVVGLSETDGGVPHVFSWTQAGGIVDVGIVGSQAIYVNSSGQIAGTVRAHAFFWTQDGGTIDLGTLGGGYSYANGLNDNGQVVGFSQTASHADHAFS
jgi:probable HAF family extracellular repeat protein